jgi:putative ABC transport system substrate-binding protein
MSYGPNFTDLRLRAAIYVDTILKGWKPADLPVERPSRTDSSEVILRADMVIE